MLQGIRRLKFDGSFLVSPSFLLELCTELSPNTFTAIVGVNTVWILVMFSHIQIHCGLWVLTVTIQTKIHTCVPFPVIKFMHLFMFYE